jgi:hypothetical protein
VEKKPRNKETADNKEEINPNPTHLLCENKQIVMPEQNQDDSHPSQEIDLYQST